MLLALKFKLAVMAGIMAAPVVMHSVAPAPRADGPEFVTIAPAEFSYRVAGDFSRTGRPAEGPRVTARLPRKLAIMKRQVTVAEYRRCIEAGACPRINISDAAAPDRPMVGVSWHDAAAFAAWMSAGTGLIYRLPTDEEWSFAAGESLRDEPAPLVDPADPAQAWIARYEAEAARADSIILAPQPVGTFGQNSNGLVDVGGNVWEWTGTCFIRASLDGEAMQVSNINCGVRVVEGAHRTYMTDFIRDPRTGGCAAGAPPANLGFRLVVENRWPLMSALIDNFLGKRRRT
jgi:formylglycine-generating enzyme required for sulfatase activity